MEPPPRRENETGSRPRARFVTFGCKVNQYDSQVLRETALAAGFRESDGEADVIVVNTCTVTEHGGAEARKAVRRLARESPGARIYVTGCYAGSDPERAASLPNVAEVLPNDRRDDLVTILGGDGGGIPFIERRVSGLRDRTRAFLKVQDGCHLRCAFCIIPSVRPALASKRPGTVTAEVSDLVRAGHREVVLTGVHLGAYGRDLDLEDPREALADLVERILAETDLPRLRLSSIEAGEVTPRLLSLLAAEVRLAPHLHLPLQSGSARVLRRMRRRGGPERFLETVEAVRERLPGCALTTDVIAGFPGETEEDHAETLEVMRRAGFMKTHVFPYSVRRGTPAAEMDGRVPAGEIRRRVGALAALDRELAAEYAAGFLGRRAEVLVESRRIRGWLTGLTGNYLRVFLEGPDDLVNRLVPVTLTEPAPGGVRGEVEAP